MSGSRLSKKMRTRVEELSLLLKREIGPLFYCKVRPDQIDAALAKTLADGGCSGVGMDFETGDDARAHRRAAPTVAPQPAPRSSAAPMNRSTPRASLIQPAAGDGRRVLGRLEGALATIAGCGALGTACGPGQVDPTKRSAGRSARPRPSAAPSQSVRHWSARPRGALPRAFQRARQFAVRPTRLHLILWPHAMTRHVKIPGEFRRGTRGQVGKSGIRCEGLRILSAGLLRLRQTRRRGRESRSRARWPNRTAHPPVRHP